MRFCSNCGNQLDENVKFCSSCGKMVEQTVVPEQVNVVEEKREETKLKSVIIYDIGNADKIKLLQYLSSVLKKDLVKTVELINKMPSKVLDGVSEVDANELVTSLTKMGVLCEAVDADTQIESFAKEESKPKVEPKKVDSNTLKKNSVIKLITTAIFLLATIFTLVLPFVAKTVTIEEESVTKNYSVLTYLIGLIESLGDGKILGLSWYFDLLIVIPITSLITPLILGVKKLIKNTINCIKVFKGKDMVEESPFSLSAYQSLSIKTILGALIPTLIIFVIISGFDSILWITPIVIFALALGAEILSKVKM